MIEIPKQVRNDTTLNVILNLIQDLILSCLEAAGGTLYEK